MESSYLSIDIQYTYFYKSLGTRGIRLLEKQMCLKDPSECQFKKIIGKMLCPKIYTYSFVHQMFLILEKCRIMENQRQETYSGARTKRCKQLPREMIFWVRISKKMYVVLEQSVMKEWNSSQLLHTRWHCGCRGTLNWFFCYLNLLQKLCSWENNTVLCNLQLYRKV